MTIIYSNALDNDCQLLQYVWLGLDDVRLVEIRPDSVDYEDTVDNAISKENDMLIICGHGDSHGLLYPDLTRGEYVVHLINAKHIHARNVFLFWCNANVFAYDNHINSFSTGMFISNMREALNEGILNATDEQITSTTRQFCVEINDLLRNNVPTSEWQMAIGCRMDLLNEVDTFNRQGLLTI